MSQIHVCQGEENIISPHSERSELGAFLILFLLRGSKWLLLCLCEWLLLCVRERLLHLSLL